MRGIGWKKNELPEKEKKNEDTKKKRYEESNEETEKERMNERKTER